MATATSTTVPAADKPDIAVIEQGLYMAGNLAGILHELLNNIDHPPEGMRGGSFLSLTEFQRDQLTFLSNQIRQEIEKAESGIA